MKLLRTIASLSLAILVLVSSSSFVVGMHFCGNKLQNIALFSKAEGCASELQLPPCHTQTRDACCGDETIVHEGQDLKPDITQIQLSPVSSVDLEQSQVLISEIIPSTPLCGKIVFYPDDTPLPSPDLTIALRVFLI